MVAMVKAKADEVSNESAPRMRKLPSSNIIFDVIPASHRINRVGHNTETPNKIATRPTTIQLSDDKECFR